MVRRKRQNVDGLPLPRHLWVGAAARDPEGWRAARIEWARQHEWPPGKIGFLAFFRETRETYRAAMGLD